MGLNITADQLVPMTEINSQTNQREESGEALQQFTSGLFNASRYICPSKPDNDKVSLSQQQKVELQTCIDQLRQLIPDYQTAMEDFTKIAARKTGAYIARSLISADIQVDPEYFYLQGATKQDADNAWQSEVTNFNEAEKKLSSFEMLMARRIELGLISALNSGGEIGYNEISQLCDTMKSLAAVSEELEQLHNHSWAVAYLIGMSENEETQVPQNVLNQHMNICKEVYARLLNMLSKTAYPYSRGDEIKTIGDYILHKCGDPDDFIYNPVECAQNVGIISDNMYYLHWRVMSSITSTCQKLESALGIQPLKLVLNIPTNPDNNVA
jgi:hypothetical protein